MLYLKKNRRSRHEHSSKKCRLSFESSGTFGVYEKIGV